MGLYAHAARFNTFALSARRNGGMNPPRVPLRFALGYGLIGLSARPCGWQTIDTVFLGMPICGGLARWMWPAYLRHALVGGIFVVVVALVVVVTFVVVVVAFVVVLVVVVVAFVVVLVVVVVAFVVVLVVVVVAFVVVFDVVAGVVRVVVVRLSSSVFSDAEDAVVRSAVDVVVVTLVEDVVVFSVDTVDGLEAAGVDLVVLLRLASASTLDVTELLVLLGSLSSMGAVSETDDSAEG